LAVSIPRQHIQSDECVEKIGNAAWMESDLLLKLPPRERFVAQRCEHAQLDG
jgi:hypothetical protein